MRNPNNKFSQHDARHCTPATASSACLRISPSHAGDLRLRNEDKTARPVADASVIQAT